MQVPIAANQFPYHLYALYSSMESKGDAIVPTGA